MISKEDIIELVINEPEKFNEIKIGEKIDLSEVDFSGQELKEVDFVSGADLMVRKSVLDEVGFFDEDFFLYYEDVELQYRIKKAGHKIYINPNAKIAHLEGASSKNRVVRRKYALEAEYLFFKKAYNLSKFSLVKILFFMSHLLRFCTNPKMILQVWRYICKA